MKNTDKRIAVILLNFNGKNLLERFLPYLMKYTDKKISNLYVIDNSSNDDSVSFLKENYASVKVIINKKNLGYAGGYNEGIKNKIDPGKSTDQDLYQMTEAEFKKLEIKQLPKNLLQAIEALKKDKLSDEVLGSVMKKSYLSYKNDEWERYHQAVTDWEVKEYLRLY